MAADGSVSWHEVPDPTPTPLETPTRQQVPEMTRFHGGGGIWHDGGVLYFTTKGDKRLWAFDARTGMLESCSTTPPRRTRRSTRWTT